MTQRPMVIDAQYVIWHWLVKRIIENMFKNYGHIHKYSLGTGANISKSQDSHTQINLFSLLVLFFPFDFVFYMFSPYVVGTKINV